MRTSLFLATHDCVSDPIPRKCMIIGRVQIASRTGEHIVVEVDPPFTVAFQGGPVQEHDSVILAVLGGRTIEDVGSRDVLVDLVLSPKNRGGRLTEKECSRMGTGSLHANYNDALHASPLDELERTIQAHVHDRDNTSLRLLHVAFLKAKLFIPLANPVSKATPGYCDLPVLCERDNAGEGVLPVFTTKEHLLEWKPEGCLYTNLNGKVLLQMASAMTGVSAVLVNPAGVPRGRIPREDFEKMLLAN